MRTISKPRISALVAPLIMLPIRALAEPGAPLCAPCFRRSSPHPLQSFRELADTGGTTRFGILALNPRQNAVDTASLEAADQLRVPIGLPIGTNHTAEIAISIAAELLQTRDTPSSPSR